MTTPAPAAGSPTASDGIQFPVDASGNRSTTRPGATIVAASLEPLDAGHAEAARAEAHWRRAYPTHFRRLVEGSITQGDRVLDSARTGLQAAWSTLCWTQDGHDRTLESAWADLGRPDGPTSAVPLLHTHTLRGHGPDAPAPWSLPDGQGGWLDPDGVRQRTDDWVRRGIIEPGAAAAVERCLAHPEWFDLSDRTLVLLGAASEAGPLRWLARWRARLLAVDIARPAVWQRIAACIEAGNATLHAPLAATADTGAATAADLDWTERAGVDLLRDAPAIAAWICGFDTRLDVAAHAYLDGERHVRVTLAMDWIQRAACAARADTTLAFMATPTDVFAVPAEAAQAARQAWHERPIGTRLLQQPLRLAAGERFFQPNVEDLLRTPGGVEYGVIDSLVLEQGPNYALAKRLQQWRALTARAAGHRVSLNVAPSTTTASVVKNPALAAGFAGADAFGIEVFEPETTNALMAALWVHDLRCDESPANPARTLEHPLELFMRQACHGGLWRSAYRPRSALPFAAALGWVRSRAS